jgi:glycosyltransferase involved in cell wall biosynthesis
MSQTGDTAAPQLTPAVLTPARAERAAATALATGPTATVTALRGPGSDALRAAAEALRPVAASLPDLAPAFDAPAVPVHTVPTLAPVADDRPLHLVPATPTGLASGRPASGLVAAGPVTGLIPTSFADLDADAEARFALPRRATTPVAGAPALLRRRPRIAIAHDHLLLRRGAERVVLALAKAFPDAPIYTSLYDQATTFPEFRDMDVRPAPINENTWMRNHYREVIGGLAMSWSKIHVDADLVISSSSGLSHGVRTSGRKLVYCYSPARWLYNTERYMPNATLTQKATMRTLTPVMRGWDHRAAATADAYVAVSSPVQQFVAAEYGINAALLAAPHAMSSTGHTEPVPGFDLADGFALVVSRLLPYKHVDAIVDAVRGTSRELVIVGTGPAQRELRRGMPGNVRMLSNLSDAQLRWLYGKAGAFVAAGDEDYSLAPLEAGALGVPSVVLRRGGLVDTTLEGITGVFFDEPTPDAIRAALEKADRTRWNPLVIAAHAAQFSEGAFVASMRAAATTVLEGRTLA